MSLRLEYCAHCNEEWWDLDVRPFERCDQVHDTACAICRAKHRQLGFYPCEQPTLDAGLSMSPSTPGGTFPHIFTILTLGEQMLIARVMPIMVKTR